MFVKTSCLLYLMQILAYVHNWLKSIGAISFLINEYLLCGDGSAATFLSISCHLLKDAKHESIIYNCLFWLEMWAIMFVWPDIITHFHAVSRSVWCRYGMDMLYYWILYYIHPGSSRHDPRRCVIILYTKYSNAPPKRDTPWLPQAWYSMMLRSTLKTLSFTMIFDIIVLHTDTLTLPPGMIHRYTGCAPVFDSVILGSADSMTLPPGMIHRLCASFLIVFL